MKRRLPIRAGRAQPGAILVGADTGGTFTDLVALVRGEVRVHKVLSTPADPAGAVLRGLREMLSGIAPALLTYSTTVATNALLERKGARVALFTDAGFEDLIEIGRQNRTELYTLTPERPQPLVARGMRVGVGGRTAFDGAVLKPLTASDLKRIARLARHLRADSFAVCLLHSYANSRSEELLARALAPLGRPLSVSHRLLAEYREYERLSTTVINAYLAPRMATHLAELGGGLAGSGLRVMQSDGGAIGLERAQAEPVRTLLSGPSAGVIGAAATAGAIRLDRFITFDMGGTSTDVSLFDGGPKIRTLSYPAGYAVRCPVIDIHTVGAGGGSIARVDAGGSLMVGPRSAGADPGPACYGRGQMPTVTDAALVAGRLIADNFLGGAMLLDRNRARRVIGDLAKAMKSTTLQAALGVIRVINANMERAIRVISVARGFDPRDFALMAFGGAGPMHAAELALELGIRHIVMPLNPGLLCARGALGAPISREYSLTVRDAAPVWARLMRRARPMMARARSELAAEGARTAPINCRLFADMRYRGQSHELEIALTQRLIEDFHAAHRAAFGHAAPTAPVEVVNLRLRASANQYSLAPRRIARGRGKPTPAAYREALVGGRLRRVPVYTRETLAAGARFSGPAIVTELSATSYVAPEFHARIDDFANLHLEAR